MALYPDEVLHFPKSVLHEFHPQNLQAGLVIQDVFKRVLTNRTAIWNLPLQERRIIEVKRTRETTYFNPLPNAVYLFNNEREKP